MITQRVRPLREVDDDGFADMVGRDLKGQTDLTEYNLLRQPENVVRWHRELIFIQKDIEYQFNEIKLSSDPPEVKAQRRIGMRTVLKHINRDRKLAQYTMNQHGLLDHSEGHIVSGLHDLEHALGDGRTEDAQLMIQGLLDTLENRMKENH